MNTDTFFHLLQERLQAAAKPERAKQMMAYMRDQFPFMGVPAPERRAIVKNLIKEQGKPGVDEWSLLSDLCFAKHTPRELGYALGDIYVPQKKKLPESMLPSIEALILTDSWWDTVDWLAPHLAAGIMQGNDQLTEEVTHRWINDDNIWLQRSAIIFQLNAKENTREDLLFRYVKRRADSQEFFVQKGAGWALRQYSKIAPEKVVQFIRTNTLPPLTVREGLKVLKKEGYVE